MQQGYPAKVAAHMAANPPPKVELWTDNEAAKEVFEPMMTQWRMGPAGPFGLDFGVLQMVANMCERELTPDLFYCIRIMQDESLKVFAENGRQ